MQPAAETSISHRWPAAIRQQPNVLVVDDDIDYATSLAEILEEHNHVVVLAHNFEDAVRCVREHSVDVAVVDIRLGSASGIDLIGALVEADATIACVMMTGYNSFDSAVATLRSRAYDYLQKPFTEDELSNALRRAFDHVTLTREKVAIQMELAELLTENRALVHRSIATQERESRSLARELHDEIGQHLTAIKADASTILGLTSSAKIKESAAAILRSSSRIYDAAHATMQRLRPGSLDELGLQSAIQEELDNWAKRHPDVHCEFNASGEFGALVEEQKISLYRIAQECLANISRHASATRVSLSLAILGSGADARVEFVARDNGVGIRYARGDGLGLIGMRERAEMLQGTFAVASERGQGVTITVTLPARAAE